MVLRELLPGSGVFMPESGINELFGVGRVVGLWLLFGMKFSKISGKPVKHLYRGLGKMLIVNK